MNALLRKELRELARFAVPIAIVWIAWWIHVSPAAGLVGDGGGALVDVAMATVAVGMLLGLAPFEVERLRESTGYLVHRGVSAPDVAAAKLAAAGIWTVAILAAGVALAVWQSLVPALVVPGYFGRALAALLTTLAIAAPSVAIGAFVGSSIAQTWARWIALVVAGIGVLQIGGRLSSIEFEPSPLGANVFLATCALLCALGSWIAIAQFAADVREDARRSSVLRNGRLALAMLVCAPVLLQVAQNVQYEARKLAWRSNAYWIRGEDGEVQQRAPGPVPHERVAHIARLSLSGRAYIEESEDLLFHPVAGTSSWWPAMLGQHVKPWVLTHWTFGAEARSIGTRIGIDGWNVWVDHDIDCIVSRWTDEWGRPSFAAFPLGESESGPAFDASIRSVQAHPNRADSVLVTDPSDRVRGALVRYSGGVEYQRRNLPDDARILDTVYAGQFEFVDAHDDLAPRSGLVLVCESGDYVFDGDAFLRVQSFVPFTHTEHRVGEGIEFTVRGYDGLAYDLTLRDERDGSVLATGRIEPRSSGELLGAGVALLATLARVPAVTLFAHALSPADDDGSATPATSLWIDPLMVGGRRPWLVVLNQLFALALAWFARRRLGGRAWGWPLAIVVLGVAAWLVCRVLEPRKAAARATPAPRSVPGWVPIVDRAGA